MKVAPAVFFCALMLAAFPVACLTTAFAEPKHGLSIFGALKYPADFKHFDYVDPDAPKGGRIITMGTTGSSSYDSFNNYIVKGDAAQGLDLLFDSLMVRAVDEPDAMYGLIAKTAEVAGDGMSVTFKLRAQAKFSDGTAVTSEDVIASFKLLKEKARPEYGLALRDVEKAEAPDSETVVYGFKGSLVRDLPVTLASLPVFSKAYYEKHNFEESNLDPPLGSGPYLMKDFKPGASVSYKLKPDYWAKDLPVNKGRFNFEEIRFEYFRERTVEQEAIKSGVLDLREEFTSFAWATGYDVAAVRDHRLIRDTLPDENPSGAQGFFINTRREKFKDVRVRRALGEAFDFEWSNNKLFYKLYTRTQSFFENSDMKASGKPSPEELALLEPYKDMVAAEVFGEPVSPPVTDGTGNNRENLKMAHDLLAEAGWTIEREAIDDASCGLVCRLLTSLGLKSKPVASVARNAKGETLDIEILYFEDAFERIISPYVANLKKIGVNAMARKVDPAQYERRYKSFDFDITIQRLSLRLTPGTELRSFWGSQSARLDGSQNLSGIADPVVDVLIDKVIAAKSRAELLTATHAIDRVLRAGYYWVPHWYKASHNVAYWDKFSRPETSAKYDPGILDTWWFDKDKAAALAARGGTSSKSSAPAGGTPEAAKSEGK